MELNGEVVEGVERERRGGCPLLCSDSDDVWISGSSTFQALSLVRGEGSWKRGGGGGGGGLEAVYTLHVMNMPTWFSVTDYNTM